MREISEMPDRIYVWEDVERNLRMQTRTPPNFPTVCYVRADLADLQAKPVETDKIIQAAVHDARKQLNAARRSAAGSGRIAEIVRIDMDVLQVLVDAAAKPVEPEVVERVREFLTNERDNIFYLMVRGRVREYNVGLLKERLTAQIAILTAQPKGSDDV